MTARTTALRSRSFRALLVGQTVTSFGNGLAPIALAYAVLETGGSVGAVGLVAAAYAVLFAATLLWGGIIGDRDRRDRVMVWSSALRGVVQGVSGLVVLTNGDLLWLLALLAAVNGAITGLSVPSSRSVTRLTVPPEALGSAVAIRAAAQDGARILGAASAGVLVTTIGSGWALLVDALTFVVATWAFALLRLPEAPARGSGPPAPHLAQLREGVQEVLALPWLGITIVQALVFHLLWGGIESAVGPSVVAQVAGPEAWGLAMGAVGVGVLLGGLLAVRVQPRRRVLWSVVWLSLTGLLPLAIASTDAVGWWLGAAVLHGLGLQVYSIYLDVALQEGVRPDRLARVYALDQVGSLASRPVGLVLVGPVVALVAPRQWTGAVGVALVVSALLVLLSSSVRRAHETVPAAEDRSGGQGAAASS